MTYIVSTRKPTNFPALTSRDSDEAAWPVGLKVIQCQAAATLLIGDAVYLDSNAKAAKSATAADYLKVLGIVVGGTSFSPTGEANFVSAGVGLTAATADQIVLIATFGSVCYAYAGATIANGSRLGIDATAGRLDDTATGNLFALALEAGVDNAGIKVFLNTLEVQA